MQGMANVTAAGNLTRDPELRYTKSQTAVTGFGLAINTKRGGQEKTLFLDVTFFGRAAEIVSEYCSKGDGIIVTGRLEPDEWTGKDGETRKKIQCVAQDFTFLPRGEQRDKRPRESDAAIDNDLPF